MEALRSDSWRFWIKFLDRIRGTWNERSAGHSQRAKAVNEERETWMSDCADRRYREDDEIAIRKGQ